MDEGGKTVPLKALQAERQRAAEAVAALEALKAERKAQEDADAAKRGEYKSLYEAEKARADEAAGRLTAFEAAEASRVTAISTRNAERIGLLTNEQRGLVPDGLSPEATALHLDRLDAILRSGAGTAAAGGGRASGGSASGDVLTPEERAWAETYQDGDLIKKGVGVAVVRQMFNKFGTKGRK